MLLNYVMNGRLRTRAFVSIKIHVHKGTYELMVLAEYSKLFMKYQLSIIDKKL